MIKPITPQRTEKMNFDGSSTSITGRNPTRAQKVAGQGLFDAVAVPFQFVADEGPILSRCCPVDLHDMAHAAAVVRPQQYVEKGSADGRGT